MLIPSPHSSAPLIASIQIAVWILPQELTLEWGKQLLGDKIITNVAGLLDENIWECMFYLYLSHIVIDSGLGDIPRFSTGSANISIVCKETNILVSFVL